jgi:hypothetical protein
MAYLLLHLLHFELVAAQLGVIHPIRLVPVLLGNYLLDLSDEASAGYADGLARRL